MLGNSQYLKIEALSCRSNSTIAQELREKLETLKDIFQEEIRPVWKKEFISLYCFLPWYALVNLLLVIAARKEIKILVLLWIAFTVGFLIWSFVLVSIMFGYDTTPGFVAGVGIAQLFNFIIMIGYEKNYDTALLPNFVRKP